MIWAWYFKIVSNFASLTTREITYSNFEISLVVFIPNITTNHGVTYTNLYLSFKESWIRLEFKASRWVCYTLFLKAPCKRTQYCWPITPNIVGCYMLRPFAHPVPCYWMLLCVVGSCRIRLHTTANKDETTPNIALLAQQCCELLRPLARSLRTTFLQAASCYVSLILDAKLIKLEDMRTLTLIFSLCDSAAP